MNDKYIENMVGMISTTLIHEKPLSEHQFFKACRYASRAGGAGRTSRLRKKKLKATFRVWCNAPSTTSFLGRIFSLGTLSNQELAA